MTTSQRKPSIRFKVTQDIKHPDGSSDKKVREFNSLSDFKKTMILMGFPTVVTYDLQKHGKAHFDYDEFSVDLTLESL